jgi:predicted alpha/beta superfamily hydrolase
MNGASLGNAPQTGGFVSISHLRFFVFLAVFSSPAALCAEPSTLPLPVETGRIESALLEETREFWVALPDGYRDATKRFPIVYMMDGELNFNSGCIGGVRLGAQMGEFPDFIIVGIRNTDREKDVFPEVITYPDGSKGGGRANQYLDFVREELIPKVEKTYRTDGFRVLYGTSNSGFTTVYALLRSPSMADAYIAASATLEVPSFLEKRGSLVRDFKGGKRKLSLVMGERDFPTIISQNGALKELIDTSAPAGLSCRLAVLRGAGHVPANSLVEGLRDLFDGWKANGKPGPPAETLPPG